MCFKVHWNRVCAVCDMEDGFSEEVVHCPTIKALKLDNGMMDCVAKNEIISANAAPYVCEDCSEGGIPNWAEYQSWPEVSQAK